MKDKPAGWMRGVLVLLGLNISVVAFYLLWHIADSMAIARMEDTVGFDPAYLLPNWELTWVAAHASLLMLALTDVLVVKHLRALAKEGGRASVPL